MGVAYSSYWNDHRNGEIVGLIIAAIAPPCGATIGYNSNNHAKTHSLLYIQKNHCILNMPIIKIRWNRYANQLNLKNSLLYQIDMVTINFN